MKANVQHIAIPRLLPHPCGRARTQPHGSHAAYSKAIARAPQAAALYFGRGNVEQARPPAELGDPRMRHDWEQGRLGMTRNDSE